MEFAVESYRLGGWDFGGVGADKFAGVGKSHLNELIEGQQLKRGEEVHALHHRCRRGGKALLLGHVQSA